MHNENNSYRIRTQVGADTPNVVNVKLDQSFEFLNILSLKIGQKNLYKTAASPYGVIVGRVIANKAYGIQNAKVSVFIPKNGTIFNVKDDILYAYSSVTSSNKDGVRYNLLPSYVDEACHQNVGTMFEKEYVLDNNDVIKVFDEYYTYTTSTNSSGDYFIYGVPVGQHTLHVDVDLSDIGKLSVRPHDMIGQGYTLEQFESPNKFKSDRNLNILPQIKSQNIPVYVYPFWGDTTEDETNASITRADIEIDYKFEPTAVFIGSIVTDKGSNSISHKCIADDKTGKMSELTTGEGKIEMIRKTFDGKVEEFSVKGNRLIDGDGVWCYQVPMNLDYVGMDEFGNIVPTDNPDKGIPTRARVRFRISLDEDPLDDSARKRARFLVPNNPRLTSDYPSFNSSHEADYEFGTFTKDESYRDMFWNNVYTVKSYIPRLQKRSIVNTKKFTGIKATNHAGDNNPMPYNNLAIKMTFGYRFICVLLTLFIYIVWAINAVLAPIGVVLMWLGDVLMDFSNLRVIKALFKDNGKFLTGLRRVACSLITAGLKSVIEFDSDFCADGGTPKTYIIGPNYIHTTYEEEAGKICDEYKSSSQCVIGDHCSFLNTEVTNDIESLLNCIQNALAQENEVTSFDFHNDWVNGVLYAPLWYRKIKPKRKFFFGLIERGVQDDWCDGNSAKMAGRGGLRIKGLKLCQTCAQQRTFNTDATRQSIAPIKLRKMRKVKDNATGGTSYDPTSEKEDNCYGYKCHKKTYSLIRVDRGIIIRKETKYGEYVYYYKSVEYDSDKLRNIQTPSKFGEVKILFATDIVLLGSLNDCDTNGIPQFFKHLMSTTYQMPPDLVSMTWEVNDEDINGFSGENVDEYGAIDKSSVHTEYTGADYGNAGWDQWYNPNSYSEANYVKKGDNEHDNGGLFYNLTCNFSYVKPKSCVNLSRVCEFGVLLDQSTDFINHENEVETLPPDGYISYDEIYNMDARAMFATLNGNWLREKINPKTGFPIYDFNYLYPENFDGTLRNLMSNIPSTVAYYGNKNLERSSDAYLRFRYGYDKDNFKVSFYDSDMRLGYIPSGSSSDAKKNVRRFPRYENSFYFYFGLKHGKTAIEKFRSQFYAECTNDADSESIVSLNYVANSWCNDLVDFFRDGYISFDLSNLELPCSIILDERRNGETYDEVYTDINDYKIYIGAYTQELEDEGYVRLYIDSNNRQKPSDDPDFSLYTAPTVKNGYYFITIIDANGEELRQNIYFERERLTFEAMTVSFTLTNDELLERFPDDPMHTTYEQVAYDITLSPDNGAYYRDIGGCIKVTNIVNDGNPLMDNFIIRITPTETIPGYNGSEYKKVNGIVTTAGIPPIPVISDGIVFGLPKANSNYMVTVVQYCPTLDAESDNYQTKKYYISEPQPYKMFVNGIDTALLQNFNTGYKTDAYKIIHQPYPQYNEFTGISKQEAVGWLEIDKIGVTSTIDYPDDGTLLSYTGLIEDTIHALEPHNSDVYSFTDDYLFSEDSVEMDLYEYSEIPLVSEINVFPIPKYIKVKASRPSMPDYDPFDETYEIWEFDNGSQEYTQKIVNGQPAETITVREYFESGSSDAQYNVISALNTVIERRLVLLDGMIEGFWMYDPDEENKLSIITYETNETPVKTLVYYIPDVVRVMEDGPIGSLTPISTHTRYSILDTNKEENTITSCSKPTITYKKGVNPKAIFYSESGLYKLPPYCAIKNRMNITIPKNVGTIPFAANTVDQGAASMPNGMYDMFGFHIIDKRPYADINVWIPIKKYPIYWPSLNTQNSGILSEGGYYSMNGCVSGMFYNGFSTSSNCIAEFSTQTIGEKVEMYTVTTKTVNGNIVPDEFAVPTKRVLYLPPFESGHQYTYNDFKRTVSPLQGFGFDTYNTGSVNTTNRYISYPTNTYNFLFQDKRTQMALDLYPDAVFGLPEDTLVYRGAMVQPEFEGIEEPINFTVISGTSPIQQKAYDNSPEIPAGSIFSMVYGFSLPNSITSLPSSMSVNTAYIVGMTKDGRYRGVSPTYEFANIDATITMSADGQHPAVAIRFNETGPVTDYYIRKYPHRIILEYTAAQNGEEVRVEEISEEIGPSYDTAPSIAGYRYEVYIFETINIFSMATHANARVYIKDITGVRRTTGPEVIPVP